MKDRYMIKENYLLLIIIIGILSLCMYSSFALFSLEKTTTKDIITMKSASDIQTTLKVFEYKQVKVSAGNNRSVIVNVSNDTGKSIYYGVFYEMVNPSTKSDDIGIYKIDWSTNPTVGTINNDEKLPVELLIINNTSSEITINIGVAGADSNELGLEQGKYIVTETFNTGNVPEGGTETKTTTTDYNYTGAVQTATLKSGTHKLEVWGAQGGGSSSHPGGMGGYSYGTLTLTKDTNIFIYVGGQGTNDDGSFSSEATLAGGFNGGGSGVAWNGTSHNGGGGGGASDIRISEDNLYSRVIVAGGGGGGSDDANGGYGGGTSGGAGSMSGGTSTSGSSFGSGGNATYSSGECGGGGSGWYGGTGGSSENYAGGGGSGYVYTSSTASNYPSGVKLTSSYYLTDAATVGGNTSFTGTSGTSETGHSGNGYARITSTTLSSTVPSIDTSSVGIEKEPIVALKDLVTCKDNGTGCKIVLVKPATSESINGSVNAIYVLEDNNGNRYKYYKKVSIKENAVSKIIKLNQGDTWESGAEGLYATNKYTDTDGTVKYHEYRYIGAEPKNYVWFNNDMYQIIGVFDSNSHGKDGYLVKLIMANPLGGYSWGNHNSSNTSGTYSSYNNNWVGGNLNILLNEYFYNKKDTSDTYGNCSTWTYYSSNTNYRTNNCTPIVGYGIADNLRSYIETVTWYLYGSGTDQSKQNWYLCERGGNSCTSAKSGSYSPTTDAPVGLMYLSDYLYASGYYSSSDTTTQSAYYFGNNNWLYKGYEWTITPYASASIRVWHVSSGYVNDYATNPPYAARPTLYLKSTVSILGGDGTIDDPYVIE